jgi:PAS domain S-box-containing protein
MQLTRKSPVKSLLLEDEMARLETLRQYQLLDTAPETAFDDLVRLAAQVCSTPLAAISLIDSNRLWFKAKVGLAITEVEGDFSLYVQTLSQEEGVVMVRDTWTDEQFASNALVISESHIRFYAGVPLVTKEGYILGALCVLDRTPRELASEQIFALQTLGRAVMAEIQLRCNTQLLSHTLLERDQNQMVLERSKEELEAEMQRRMAELQNTTEQIQIELAERKRVEEALWQSEARYRAIVEDQTELVGRFSPDRKLTFVNEAFCRYFGQKREDLLGQSIMLPIPVEDHQKLELYFASFSPEKPVGMIENRNLLPNGELGWQQWTTRAIFDEQGRLLEFQSVGRDITARKQMEEAFQRREQKFRSLAENLPDVVARFDRNFRHLYINPVIEAITGYPPEMFLRKTNRELEMPEDLVQYWHKNLNQVFETGEATTVEFAFPSSNNLRHFEWRIVPEPELDGSIKTVLTITRDITERKQTEAALRKQNRDLALLNRTTQAFISTLDLNQILMNVLQEVRDLLEVTGGSIWLTDPKTKELFGWQATIPEHSIIQGWRLGSGQGLASWVAEHRQSLIVPDTRLEPRHFKGVDQQTGVEMRSVLSVPLLGQQEVIGVLQMVDTRVDRFKESDLELVELLATTAAIAFENASLFHALLDSEKRYHSVFEAAAIPLWEEDFSAAKAYLEALRQTGIQDFQGYLRQHPEAVHHCAALVQVVDVNKAGLDLHHIEHKDKALGSLERLLAAETLPIFSEELVAVAEDQSRFTYEAVPQEVHGNKAFVDVSWSVVPGYENTYQRVIVCLRDVTERVRAAEALRLYAERLKVLHEIDQAILTSQSAEAIAQTALAHIRRLIPCQRATVMVFDFETGEATRLAVDVDYETGIGSGSHISLRDPWITDLWLNKVQVVEDISAFPQPSPTLQALSGEGIHAFTCVPLIVQDILVGSLNLGFAHLRTLAPEQMSIAREVADSMAVAIQQARLWEAEQQAHQVSKTLHAANVALTQTLHLETVLETLLDYLIVLVPYDTASVLLIEAEFKLNRRAMRGYEQWTDPALIRQRSLNTHTYSNIETVLANQASLVIPDTHNFSDWPPVVGSEYIRNWMGVPLRLGNSIIGLYSLSKAKPNFFTQKHLQLAETLATQATVAIQNARLFEQVEAGRQQLQALSHRLVEVQEAERRHLARELHDEIGEVLTGLKFSLETSVRLPAEAGRNKLGEAQKLVRELMMRIEELSLNLRPAMLDELGLLPTLLWHIERYTTLTQVQVVFTHQGLGRRFHPEVETAAYRIVQEALTNVARHAQTREVSVRIRTNQEMIHIQITDQGAGFDLDTALAAGASNGLTGMQERAVLVGGYLMIGSAPGKGTHLTAQLPLKSVRE